MPMRFDASTKNMLGWDRDRWLSFGGLTPDGPTEFANVDLSAVTSSTDHLIRVLAKNRWAALVEFVSSYQQGLIKDIMIRVALAHSRENCPIEVLLVLLDKRAEQSVFTGVYEVGRPGFPPSLVFRFKVVRVWELSSDDLLNDSPALMPLAVLTDDHNTQDETADVLSRLFTQLNERLPDQPQAVLNLWACTELLLGLKYKGSNYRDWIMRMIRGKLAVRESIIYQDILEEGLEQGRAEGNLAMLVKLCSKRFGKPSEGERIALEAITDLERLDRMADECDQVNSWDDLLQIR